MHFIWKGKSCLTCKNNKSVVHQKVFIEKNIGNLFSKRLFAEGKFRQHFLFSQLTHGLRKCRTIWNVSARTSFVTKKEITITVVQYCETVLSEFCVKWIGHVGSASQVINNGTLKQAHFFNSDNKSDNCFVLECTCVDHFDRWC